MGMRSTSRAVLLVVALALPVVAVLISFALTDSPRSPQVPPTVEVGSSPEPPRPAPTGDAPEAPGELPPPPPDDDDDNVDEHDVDEHDDD